MALFSQVSGEEDKTGTLPKYSLLPLQRLGLL